MAVISYLMHAWGDGGCMDEVNVAVIAPILGRDLSFASDVDSRVRALDANFAATGSPRPLPPAGVANPG
jgi:hypothetical protein